MSTIDVERLRQIKTLPSLIKFLREELDWPVEADSEDELTFEYTPGELGLDAKYEKAVKEIRQIRRLDSKQPWGIFWINFDKKRLPMVVLRRVLGNLVIKKRASLRKADRPSWDLHDLLFISSYGEEEHRTITFAHFTEDPNTDELPVLRVLGWDDQNPIMGIDRVANRLHSHFRWPDHPQDVDSWRKRWSEAFTDRYREAIRSADELIPRLADLASGIRRRVRDVLEAETERGPMRRLFAAVRGMLIHDMTEDGFADMYAQTVAYGLLSARFSRSEGLTAQNLVQLTAISNPFLESLLENLFRLNRGKFHFDVDEVGINDVLDLLRNTNIEAIKAAFSDRNPDEDPVIRFYEGFLKEYDPQQRIRRGVFFTPRPVVSYIVQSIHELLQSEFGLEDGLASTITWADLQKRMPAVAIPHGVRSEDPFVRVLDPAVGTGTFLFECIEVIERTMKRKWSHELTKKDLSDFEIKQRWQQYVPRYLLPRLYGYELMMAPYAIAHMKLALKLAETGYHFQEHDRLNIYLTNSVEAPAELADTRLADMFTSLAGEAQAVNEIKAKRRFTVIMGNPPYANFSANLTAQARQLVQRYKEIDGEPLHERNALQLERNVNDDYVKFFAKCEDLLKDTGAGIFGMISNSSYLDATTLRGMRARLLRVFSGICVLDLGGASDLSGTHEHEVKDQNVFEIEQPVAISIMHMTRLPQERVEAIRYSSLRGSREEKYAALLAGPSSRQFHTVPAKLPQFVFIPHSETSSWNTWFPLDEALGVYAEGMKTGFDDALVGFSPGELRRQLQDLSDETISSQSIKLKYGVRDKGWAHGLLQDRAALSRLAKAAIRTPFTSFAYRPLDFRWVPWPSKLLKANSLVAGEHLRQRSVCLVAARQVSGPSSVSHFYVSRAVPDNRIFYSKKGSATYFPITRLHGGTLFTETFIKALTRALRIRWDDAGGEDAVGSYDGLYYIYAIFHSPTYREDNDGPLKRGFPRIPLTSSPDLFRNLGKLGNELVSLHLMESPRVEEPITKWKGASPSTVVETASYADRTVWIDEAKTEGFRGVPQDVWQFYIGGYQVCEKWLKDRKGRQLSKEDIAHYQKVVVALAETIKIMAQIDETIEAHGGWPGAFITDPKKLEDFQSKKA